MAVDAQITVSRRVRPVRLAFLVRPGSEADYLTAVEISTALWGGVYNAIIPVFQSTPAWWKDSPLPSPSAKQILDGYLQAFEPDYVVSNPELASTPLIESLRRLSSADIQLVSGSGDSNYGVNVGHIYQHLYDSQFRFQLRHPAPMCRPHCRDSKLTAFVDTVFGRFPLQGPAACLPQVYDDAFGATVEGVNAGSFINLLIGSAGFPLGVGRWGLERRHSGAWELDTALFFMDATKIRDLIDFWNLRAIGRRVLPIARQWANDQVSAWSEWLKLEIAKKGPHQLPHVSIIKSRSIVLEEMEAFARKIVTKTGEVALQRWYPRLWEDFGRHADYSSRVTLSAEEGFHQCQIESRTLQVPVIAPSFLPKNPGIYERWVNVLNFQRPTGDDTIATVIPPNLKDAGGYIGALGIEEISVSTEGISSTVGSVDTMTYLTIPDGQTIFSAWLQGFGYTVKLSEGGRITEQVIRSLGLRGMRAIAHGEIIELLNKMAEGLVETVPTELDDGNRALPFRGRIESRTKWWALLKRLHTNNPRLAERNMAALLDRGALRLGARLKCTECGQANWYSLEDIATEVRCDRCLRLFKFPTVNVPSDLWYYRTQGPFSIPGYANGAYSVALALSFLTSSYLSAGATWVAGCEMRHPTEGLLEADFTLWHQQMGRGIVKRNLIFGEGKSFGGDTFRPRDIERAKTLAQKFPGAVLAFATLKPDLHPAEKARLKKLAVWGRARISNNRSRAPVLVLTANELFANTRLSQQYEKLGGKFGAMGAVLRHRSDLLPICDATQQLYLDLNPYDAWHREYWEKRHRKRQQQAEARKPQSSDV
jgi:hypothetical protein